MIYDKKEAENGAGKVKEGKVSRDLSRF